tara:strand:- start:476 stop:820 length:345 start_codon:yes stop_codon:yes gene_type:complete
MTPTPLQDTREIIREEFANQPAAQEDLRNYFTKNPASIRASKEREEMEGFGLIPKDGHFVSLKTLQPADPEMIARALKITDERMLTEGNPEMLRHNFNYSGGKILPMNKVEDEK